ncbi:MAG: TetR/AcrR family transcriptional regulator [Hyphomonadaceae bacterium]|nr:TetR/AcrR family transcriptional regulator [Hyphomonadaceae bacterium]
MTVRTKANVRPEMPENTSLIERGFPDQLKAELRADASLRKGERTRRSLVWATASLLNERGYHDVRISDICDRAKVSSAAFYQYFENKAEITQIALSQFSDAIFNHLSGVRAPKDNKEALLEANLAWLRIAKANSGLMRSTLQVGFEIEACAAYYDGLNSQYMERMAYAFHRRAGLNIDHARVLSAALSSMTDDFTRRLLSEANSDLADIVERSFADERELAEFLTDIWYKSIYSGL